MEKGSAYPNVRKFYVSLRTAEQVWYSAMQTTNIPPEVHNLRRHAMVFLADALKEGDMPIGEVDEACHAMFGVIENNQKQYEDFFDSIENSLSKNWPDEASACLVKGEAYIKKAWFARGNGYANTVTAERFKLFKEHLTAAEAALNHAWQLNPGDSRIPVKMLTVAMGQGQGRDQMELWFGRAMKLDPNSYEACSAKLFYLEPKWYGSTAAMLAFGRECATNQAWGGHIPLIILDAHKSIQRQYVDGSQKNDYWKQPEVWSDLKPAFDRFFELNPEAISWYHDYAWYAYRAGQWDTLNKIIPKLGPINYPYFGGKDEFDKMVRLAKEHSGQPK